MDTMKNAELEGPGGFVGRPGAALEPLAGGIPFPLRERGASAHIPNLREWWLEERSRFGYAPESRQDSLGGVLATADMLTPMPPSCDDSGASQPRFNNFMDALYSAVVPTP